MIFKVPLLPVITSTARGKSKGGGDYFCVVPYHLQIVLLQYHCKRVEILHHGGVTSVIVFSVLLS